MANHTFPFEHDPQWRVCPIFRQECIYIYIHIYHQMLFLAALARNHQNWGHLLDLAGSRHFGPCSLLKVFEALDDSLVPAILRSIVAWRSRRRRKKSWQVMFVDVQENMNDTHIHMYILIYIYGSFLKQGYPQVTLFNGIFHYKPPVWGYHHFGRPPYIYIHIYIYDVQTQYIYIQRCIHLYLLYTVCILYTYIIGPLQ